MVRRLKVYFIHSTRMDYNNLLYRHILSSTICLSHELMLPLTKQYKDVYVKDLMAKADIIIAEVSDYNIGLKLELKWVLEQKKPIKYISLNNTIPDKVIKLVPEIEMITEERPMIKIVEDFISHYGNMTEAQQNDPTMILGSL